MPKILWSSNAPWCGTGYGAVTKEIVPRLKAQGHEVAIAANYGLGGSTITWEDIPVFPSGIDGYSNDVLPGQIDSWIKGDDQGFAVILFDAWVYARNAALDQFPILAYAPVDHSPLPQGVAEFFRRPGLKIPLAMSQHGRGEFLKAGFSEDRVLYAPHSISRKIFTPEGSDMREKMLVPQDAHLTMINAANKGNTPVRKCWGEMLSAWSAFAHRHPEAYLYIHSDASGMANGVPLDRLLEAVKAPTDRVRVVPQYEYRMGIDSETVAALYRSADVLLATSRGEGFGIPVIEAQSCGVSAIVTDWTAQPELIGSGWIIPGQVEYDHLQGGWWKVPNVEAIISALEESFALKGDAVRSGQEREKAIIKAQGYETDHVFREYWQPALTRFAEIIRESKTGPLNPNREQRRAALRRVK